MVDTQTERQNYRHTQRKTELDHTGSHTQRKTELDILVNTHTHTHRKTELDIQVDTEKAREN